MTDKLVSIVVPLFNEELVIDEMYQRLKTAIDPVLRNYEVIMVNDGSRDSTLAKARRICVDDQKFKLVSLSRNFGHQIAITAGMDKAKGDAIVVIDADLQDPPELIGQMVEKWIGEDCMVVYGTRTSRSGESKFKLLTAAAFYRLLRKLTSVEIPVDTGDFRLIDRRVLNELRQMPERARFVRGMVSWVGFKQRSIEYQRDARFAGTTKYPFKKMLKFAIDGILSFSQVPLKVASGFGMLSAAISFVFMIYGIVVRFFYPEHSVPGWASLFSAVLFIGGVQLICIGVLGEYVGRIYEEVKRRPLYVVEEMVNIDMR